MPFRKSANYGGKEPWTVAVVDKNPECSKRRRADTITDRVMQSSLVMQNVFSPLQNMLHCLFLLDLRYMLLLAYEVIFFTKKNDSWGRIENPQGL
jgi:hypothetical protein